MFRFMQYINEQQQRSLKDYASLHQFSINEAPLFWQSLLDFFNVKTTGHANAVLSDARHIEKATWFSGLKLNFAENLLRRQDSHIAMCSIDEKGHRREYTYASLYQQVAKLAQALKEIGVKKGQRVAAVMPNMAETIIAMLATSSLGAIWSSCSPDFGYQGIMDRFSQIEPTVLITVDGYFYNGKTHNLIEKIARVSHDLSSLRKTIIVPFAKLDADISSIAHACLIDELDNDAEQIDFCPMDFNDPLYIMYSSGTTGVPKCIVHGVGGTLLQHLKELSLHSGIDDRAKFFYFTTCGWMMWNWLVSGLSLGATLVLYDGSPSYPNMNRLMDLIDDEKITHFGTSAKYIQALEKENTHPKQSHYLGSLKVIFSTGSPLSPTGFDFVYEKIKADIQLCSISGGTDIISCFALGNPILPVYRGELQCKGLGMDVAIFNDAGKKVIDEKGELVCLSPFPSCPIYFWRDKDGHKFHQAYFNRFDNTWAHGDYAKETANGGFIIYGRSDAILNPGGVRIGTAEIYRQVEKVKSVIDSVVIGQAFGDDERVVLFVQLANDIELDETLIKEIKSTIRQNTTPRHVPAKILQVSDIPKTKSGKIVEIAVKKTVMGEPINNLEALANPESLSQYKDRAELAN